jgi:hypothetical protein
MLNARNVRIYFTERQFNSRNFFLDESYREDRGTDTTSLLTRPFDVSSALLESLAYAFDMPSIPDLHEVIERGWS